MSKTSDQTRRSSRYEAQAAITNGTLYPFKMQIVIVKITSKMIKTPFMAEWRNI
jgi:hypothetical protein